MSLLKSNFLIVAPPPDILFLFACGYVSCYSLDLPFLVSSAFLNFSRHDVRAYGMVVRPQTSYKNKLITIQYGLRRERLIVVINLVLFGSTSPNPSPTSTLSWPTLL